MPKKSTKEVLWIKLKTQYKLAQMFEEENGTPHYKAPLAFANWSMFIPTSAMGRRIGLAKLIHTLMTDFIKSIGAVANGGLAKSLSLANSTF